MEMNRDSRDVVASIPKSENVSGICRRFIVD